MHVFGHQRASAFICRLVYFFRTDFAAFRGFRTELFSEKAGNRVFEVEQCRNVWILTAEEVISDTQAPKDNYNVAHQITLPRLTGSIRVRIPYVLCG